MKSTPAPARVGPAALMVGLVLACTGAPVRAAEGLALSASVALGLTALLGLLGLAVVAAALGWRASRRQAIAARAADENERRWRQLLDGTGAGVVIVRDDRIDFLNLRAAQMLGRSVPAVQGLPVADFVHADDRTALREGLGHLLDGREVLRKHQRYRVLRPDGSVLPIEVDSSCVEWQGQRVLVGVFQDASDRRQEEGVQQAQQLELERRVADRTAALEQALAAQQATEAFLRLVADNLPARLSYWDRDNRCRFANRGFCEWHGVTAEGVLGRRIADLGPPWDVRAQRNQPHIERVLAGEVRRFERDDFDPAGRPCVTLAHYVPDRRADNVVGFVVLSTDLSAEKATERRLRELNDQLAAARDRAEAATRAKSAFLANMSHEIRTPLNAIIGLTELLRRDLHEPQVQHRLGRISDASRHLMALVSDVLDLSRIEAGKLPLEALDFDPAATLRQAQALLSERAQEKGLRFVCRFDDLPPRVRGDSTRLTQALLNLAGNAVKFTERGQITLSARIGSPTADGWRLRFEVEDTGPGISVDRQALLFEPFEQGDASTTRRYGGSGLGLAITRQLVLHMGGELGFDSREGEGARFWFELPLARPAVPLSDPAALARVDGRDVEAALRRRHGHRCVLLVEDNEVNQVVASELLRSVGLRVEVAGDGQEGLDRAMRDRPDLILMDVHMPRLDGLQATRAWRAHEAVSGSARVPVVALTASAFAEERDACLAAGMDDHLSKPIDMQILFATVLRWLDAGQPDGSADSAASTFPGAG